MANNSLQFSEELTLKTEAEKQWWKDYESYCAGFHAEDDGSLFPEDANPPIFNEFIIEKNGVWFNAEEYGNVDVVAQTVQRFLKEMRPKDHFYLTYACTCSKQRVGEFGGGAIFVTAEKIEFLDVHRWVQQEIQKHQGE